MFEYSDSDGEWDSAALYDEWDWEDDDQARRQSFERKMTNATHQSEIEESGGVWEIAGKITAQFLEEIQSTDEDSDDDDQRGRDQSFSYDSAKGGDPDLYQLNMTKSNSSVISDF